MEMIDDLPKWAQGTDHYDYRILLGMNIEREPELDQYLASCQGLYRKSFRTIKDIEATQILYSDEPYWFRENLVLSFKLSDDLLLFKLTWQECEINETAALVSLIRKTVPTLIANQIIGVQPMSGAAISQIQNHLTKLSKPTTLV